jgi:methylmalonyl-CoA/ethylmalonyl-CoA epimerase
VSDVTLDRIGQIAINVQDVERATAFYRDVLGMRFLFSAPPGLAFFDCGGVRLMLSKADKPEFDHPASILYYTVADITAAHQTLTGRGVVFEGPPHIVHRAADYDLWMADFRDSEGNLLVLMSEARRG